MRTSILRILAALILATVCFGQGFIQTPPPYWYVVAPPGPLVSRPATCTPDFHVYICNGVGCTTNGEYHYCTALNTWTIASGADDFVRGASTLTTSEVHTKVTAAGIIGPSRLSESDQTIISPIIGPEALTNGTFANGLNSWTMNPAPAVGAFVFTGGGLDDATAGGTSTYGGTTFTVEITANGTPDVFRWRRGTGAWTTGVGITGAAQTLSDGFEVTFAADVGHTIGDVWVSTVTSAWTIGGGGLPTSVDGDSITQANGITTTFGQFQIEVATASADPGAHLEVQNSGLTTVANITAAGTYTYLTNFPDAVTLIATGGGWELTYVSAMSWQPYPAFLVGVQDGNPTNPLEIRWLGSSVLGIGVGAAGGNTGIDVNAFGNGAAQNNGGAYVNALGPLAASNNSGVNVNAFGSTAARSNTGDDVNALGVGTALSNTGSNVNALGNTAAQINTGSNVNAFGSTAAQSNTGDDVNALGNTAAQSNTGSAVNAFGQSAASSNTGSAVNALGNTAAQSNTGSAVNAFGEGTAYYNTGDYLNAIGFSIFGGKIAGDHVTAIGDDQWDGPLSPGYLSGVLQNISRSVLLGTSLLTQAHSDDLPIIAAAVFTGTGLDDLTSGGTYAGLADDVFTVTIDTTPGTPTPDTYTWQNTGATKTGTGNVSTGTIKLADGVTVTFSAAVGHTVADHWDIALTASTNPLDNIIAIQGEATGPNQTVLGNAATETVRIYGKFDPLVSNLPSWQKYSLVKIANTVNGCANATGCWQVNGVLGANAAAGLTQDVVLHALPAKAQVTDWRMKTATACTGATTALSGLGNTGNTTLYRAQTYDIAAAVADANLSTGPTAGAGSNTAAGTNAIASLITTVANIDQLVAGCAVDYWILWGVLP